ncbi:MAG TPA: DUF4389 domain-containing protein [Trebonia sp.]
MTETSYYPPTESPQRRDATGTPGPVLVAVAGPAPQRRVTVAIRLILAVPHLVVLYVLGIGALVVAVIGWLGALVTGRPPRFAAAYLSGYLRWYFRVAAYLLLLTGKYPPFAFGDAAYPVRLTVGSGKLNRLTVLFRIVLAIPAAIVSILLTSGFATVAVFIAWLIALIAGRLPAPLHQAFAAVLRYAIRYYGYLYLLTGTYPAGLFGDQPGFPAGAVPGPAEGYAPPAQGYGPPPEGYTPPAQAYGPPAADCGPSGYGAPWPPVQPLAEDDATGQAPDWRLVLSAGARRLVGLILVLGLLTAAGAGAWAGVTISAIRQRDREISQLKVDVAQFNAVVARHNAAVIKEEGASSQIDNAVEELSGANSTLDGVLNSATTDFNNCSTVSCFNDTAVPVAAGFAAFGRTLRATTVPASSAAIAKRLLADTTENEQNWTEITDASSFDSVESIATATETYGGRFDNDYPALMTSLNNAEKTLSNEADALNTATTTLDREGAALERRAIALNVTFGVRPVTQAV